MFLAQNMARIETNRQTYFELTNFENVSQATLAPVSSVQVRVSGNHGLTLGESLSLPHM